MILSRASEEYLVSAIVSAYNSERFMLDRLQNLVEQTLFEKNRLEIIVIDSGSAQNEEHIISEFMRRHNHLVYVRTGARESVYGAWNRGIRLAKGRYVINANTDDRFAAKALERLADAVDRNSGLQAAYGDWLQTEVENDCFESNTPKETFTYPEFDPTLLFHSQITSHAAMIRKDVFEKIGLFNGEFEVYGDREFMLRFSVNGFKAQRIPEIVGLYFKNADGLEFSRKESGDREYRRLLERFLLPEYFIRLFDRDRIPKNRELAQLYACAGSNAKEFMRIGDQPVSNFGTAAVLFNKALEYDAGSVPALNNLAVIACVSGDPMRGMQLFEKALSACPPGQRSNIQANLTRAGGGSRSVDEYFWMNAAIHEPEAQKENPMKSQVQMYQDVQAIVNRGGYRQAIDELQNLLRVYPQFALAHNDLGVLLYQQGDKECALSHYEQAAEIQPANITFQKNLADFYYVEQGRVEDALRIYVRILENHPEDVETLLITGHICVALQKFDDAKDFYRRVLQIEPWNSGASENLDKIEKILAGTTTGPDADQLYREAQQMALADRNQEAIDQLEKLVASSPEFAMAHNDLGVLYYKTGRKEKACQHYEEAARLEPGNMIFLKNLADYYCLRRIEQIRSRHETLRQGACE